MRKALTMVLAGGAAATLALGLAAPAGAASTKAKAWGGPGSQTITAIAAADPTDFSYLVTALQATGLDKVLDSNDGTYTVFAPTNAAFEKAATELGVTYPDGSPNVPALLGLLVSTGLADDVLLYHVTSDRRFSNSVVPHQGTKAITTLEGESFRVTSGGQIIDAAPQTQNANLVPTMVNIKASNGVIHVIDDVLVPQVVVDALAG